MAVVLIKLVPKTPQTTGDATPVAATSKNVAADVDIPGVVSTVKKENKTISRLLWAGVGSVATILLMSLFGRSRN